MTERYKIVEGSQSGHCCFDFTVVDTQEPLSYDPEGFKAICECFELRDAQVVCNALNNEWN
jgi:hypothetical protein